jgi:hypothetical protein
VDPQVDLALIDYPVPSCGANARGCGCIKSVKIASATNLMPALVGQPSVERRSEQTREARLAPMAPRSPPTQRLSL